MGWSYRSSFKMALTSGVNSRRIVMGSPLFIFVGRSRYAADKRSPLPSVGGEPLAGLHCYFLSETILLWCKIGHK
jgi:hypothetical protein